MMRGGSAITLASAPLRRLRIGSRLLLLASVPVGLLLVTIGLTVSRSVEELETLHTFHDTVGAVDTLYSFTASVQAEREATAIHLVAQTKVEAAKRERGLPAEVEDARGLVDAHLDSLVDGPNHVLAPSHAESLASRFDSARRSTDSVVATPEAAVDAFGPILDDLSQLLAAVTADPPTPELNRRIDAFLSLMAAHEFASVEYLLVLANGQSPLSTDQTVHVSSIHRGELSSLERFVLDADAATLSTYQATFLTPSWRVVNDLRGEVRNFRAIDPDAWNEASVERLATLEELIWLQQAQVHNGVDADFEDTRKQLGRTIGASVAAFVLALLSQVLLHRSLVAPLYELNTAAVELSAGRTYPVAMTGRDELTQVGGAFQSLHDNMQRLWQDTRRVGDAVQAGGTGDRIITDAYEGDWQQLVRGFNTTLEAQESANERVRRESRFRHALSSISGRALVATRPEDLVSIGLGELQTALEVERVAIVAHPETGVVEPAFLTETGPIFCIENGPENGPSWTVLSERKKTVVAATIAGANQPLGMLVAELCSADDDMVEEAKQLVEAVALILAQAHRRYLAEETVRYQSNYEAVTGLPNLTAFESWLNTALDDPSRRPIAVIAVSATGLPQLEITDGRAVRDAALRDAAHRIRELVGRSGVVAFVRGDQFIVGIAPSTDPDADARSVVRALEEPWWNGEAEHRLRPIAGHAVVDKVERAQAALAEALTACHAAFEREGSDDLVLAYTEDLDAAISQRLARERLVDDMFTRQAFEVWYQPIFETATGRTVGYEALVRGRDQDGRLVSPGEFVPVAETNDRIHELGHLVLEQAVADLLRLPGDNPFVSVNVAPRQLERADFVERVDATIRRAGVRSDRVGLELTEGTLLGDDPAVLERIETLCSHGHSLSLDDFGTGYSSLSYLTRLPFSVLKLDMSLVREIEEKSGDRAVAASAIDMAHSIDLVVVAEGVETEGQRRILEDLGCDRLQGYLLGRPAPLDDYLGL